MGGVEWMEMRLGCGFFWGVKEWGGKERGGEAHRSVDMDFEENSLLERKAFDLW